MYNGMNLDSEAIFKAYKDEATPITVVNDTLKKCYDKDGNEVAIDSAKVNAARTTLDAEALAVKYKTDRTTDGSTTYDTIGNQLDMLYADMLAGKLDTTGTWATHIKAVKDANPKPS